jgi:hypothetical protein
MSNLTQFIGIGRGLIQLPDATIEVLPDGTTLTFDASNQLYIPDNAIGTTKIVDGAITTAKIVDANITTAKIADAQITKAKMTDTGRAQIFFKYYEGLSATTISYDAPFLLNGWKLLRVNVVTRNWLGDASNYWTVSIYRVDTSNTATLIGTINCVPTTGNPTWMLYFISSYTADADYILYANIGKVGAPPSFDGYIQYVIVPTDTVYKY